MLPTFVALAACIVSSVRCDRFQDYNKFPNRRYGDQSRGTYDYERTGGDQLNYGRTGYGAGTSDGYGGSTGGYGGSTGGYGGSTGGYGGSTGGYGVSTDAYGRTDGYANGGYGGYGGGYGGGYDDNGAGYCKTRSAQMDIEMEQLMGMWYAVEVIQHLVGNPGTYATDSCIVLHIAETTNKPSTESGPYHRAVLQTNMWRENRHLQLVWDENGQDLEYSLHFKNDSVGFWNSNGNQMGSLAMRRGYQPFTGSVQVLKAVGDHLLLLFCQAQTVGQPAQLFSVLLSREPRRMRHWEVESAHALLRRKNLSVSTRRLVCGNGAAARLASLLLTTLLAAALQLSCS